MLKPAQTTFPLNDLIKQRWSTVIFDSKIVENEKIATLLEAARWAASCYNEQPWNFIVATKENPIQYQKLLSCLVEANQVWAKNAPVLMIAVAKNIFTHNGKPNFHALYDLGLAVGNLSIQAQELGLFVHQMGGFDSAKTQQLYQIPQDYTPVVAIALGYLGQIQDFEETLQKRELSPRTRKPLDSFVFSNIWGESSHLIK
jgi:nitroreductase